MFHTNFTIPPTFRSIPSNFYDPVLPNVSLFEYIIDRTLETSEIGEEKVSVFHFK